MKQVTRDSVSTQILKRKPPTVSDTGGAPETCDILYGGLRDMEYIDRGADREAREMEFSNRGREMDCRGAREMDNDDRGALEKECLQAAPRPRAPPSLGETPQGLPATAFGFSAPSDDFKKMS